MTEQERYQTFVAEFEALSRRYGFTVGAQVQPEVLGPVVQVRAAANVVAIPDWQPLSTAKVGQSEGTKEDQ